MALKGSNSFGRRCESPFTCKRNKIWEPEWLGTSTRTNKPYGCQCPLKDNSKIDSACMQCDFYADGHGGGACTKCRKSKYLHNKECIGSCKGTELAEYAPSISGRTCRSPFTCSAGRDEEGNACQCPMKGGMRTYCRTCRMDINDKQTCLECKADSARPRLVNGECKK